MKDNYTINRNTHLQELTKRWDAWLKTNKAAQDNKELVNSYIHFLIYSEKYTYAEVADVIGLSRQRVWMIADMYERKGGETK